MNHERATEQGLAERYVLDELSDVERDEFEEHYFSCVACAEDVRANASFLANTRAVLREDGDALGRVVSFERPQRSAAPMAWWSRLQGAWALSAAAALLLGVVTYQSVIVIPGLRSEVEELNAPQSLPTVIGRSISRGEDSVVRLKAEDRRFHLMLDLVRPAEYVQCEIRGEDGRLIRELRVESTGGLQVDLLLPASEFPTGRYIVALQTEPRQEGQEPQRYSFAIERK